MWKKRRKLEQDKLWTIKQNRGKQYQTSDCESSPKEAQKPARITIKNWFSKENRRINSSK